jgi:hypothetical protein
MDPRRQAAARLRVRLRSGATVPAVATVKIVPWTAVSVVITGRSLRNSADFARPFWCRRPRHYPATLASDEGGFARIKRRARLRPVTALAPDDKARNLSVQRHLTTGPQAPRDAAPPLAARA